MVDAVAVRNSANILTTIQETRKRNIEKGDKEIKRLSMELNNRGFVFYISDYIGY